MPVLPDAAVLAPMIKADETALPQSCPVRLGANVIVFALRCNPMR
jgi:hypothetical protein